MTAIESAEMERLVEAYPHLEEKAIVDFINGFSVMSDHLNEKHKVAKRGRSARFMDRLTGQSVLRQELIDTSMETSLGFIKDYVVVNEKRLVRVKEQIVFHSEALQRAEEALLAYLKEHREITAARFRDLLNISRKHAIPLLEYFDNRRLTMRVGDSRVLLGKGK